MELSLLYFTFFLIVLLSTADPTEFNTNSCPTSRHLLFFGGLNFPLGEKKTEHVSSSSKSSSSSSSSSPPKYARADNTHGLTVYIRPQTSNELGHKVRSYSHLLKSKLFTKEELARLKKLKSQKKKPTKKKNTTQSATKTRDLVAVNDQERDRCRALLQIDHQSSAIPAKASKKIKKIKNSISTKVKNVTAEAKKKVAAAAKALPVKETQKPKKITPAKTDTKSTSDQKVKPAKNNAKSAPEEKVKPTKSNAKSTSDEKKKPTTKPSETERLTPPPPVKEVPAKKPTSPPPPPSPPPPVQPSTNTKSKREKAPPPVIEEPTVTVDINEPDEIDNDEKNNSVVGRAYYFVKNMFQLSDDILENNHTHEEDQIFSSTNEQQQQQQHRTSRKLLSIEEDDDRNNYELDDIFNDLSFSTISISQRQLLSVKTNKRSVSSKGKKTNSDTNKPKVGWNYRYRISRYLADQKMKRSSHGNKAIGGGKSKQQQSNKKTSSSSNTKVSKRKLLELDFDDETNWDNDGISNHDIVNTVSITQQFVPKRQLLSAKKSVKIEDKTDDESDIDKINERRRIKSFEALTDPAEIVRSYDRGLFKPRVGWQFRYRVSRYIDSLRDNIHEDQERLKLGLQAIKRKTPQELSGRRKRVLDKPFALEPEEVPVVVEENKPNVGWRYRYRISKMLDAKNRGEFIDDEELKRKARLEQKRKQQGLAKPVDADDDECIEWEYDIDPELRKISEEGKRVGWAYRYRIRRKLDELKQIQAETGLPFDLETLGGKREKKVVLTTTDSTAASQEKAEEKNKKAVGWQYRYRVSKMREALKNEAVVKATTRKHEHVPAHERLHPELARLTPEERVVGWQYRYRIRRKLDAIKNATRETEGGRRGKKQKLPSEAHTASKEKEKMIKKVEESIEKILNIDDIEETPFMEYFRRSSIYIFSGLFPTVKRSICLLPLPVTFSFCKEDENENIQETVTTTESSRQIPTKKLRTKKEKRAKQFIHSRSTSLDTTDEKIDDPVKPLSKAPPTIVEKSQPQKKLSHQRVRSSTRRTNDEQVKHFDEEEHPVKKLIGVESKKKTNKKKFQIIGQEVKTKSKHLPALPVANPVPVTTTIPSTPATTTTPPPIVTTSAPVVQTPRTTSPPPPPTPSPKPEIVSTTTPAPLRSISEIIQEEAATLLSTQSSFTEEAKEEINEANENLQATTTTISPPDLNDSATSGEENDDSNSSDSESNSSSSDSDSDEETDDFDPLATKPYYEKAKESVHGVFDLKDEKDSS